MEMAGAEEIARGGRQSSDGGSIRVTIHDTFSVCVYSLRLPRLFPRGFLLSCWFRVAVYTPHKREREREHVNTRGRCVLASLTEALRYTHAYAKRSLAQKIRTKGRNCSANKLIDPPSVSFSLATPSVPKREQCSSGARWLTIPEADLPVDGTAVPPRRGNTPSLFR